MAKAKKAWFCNECGAESPKWVGKCQSCGSWNTLTEEIISAGKQDSLVVQFDKAEAKAINEIEINAYTRIETGLQEFDRVLGGGIVPGSMILLGGDPGIGKSTLALQISLLKSAPMYLYVSGEESSQQIKIRADRIGVNNTECFLLSETLLENIFLQAEKHKPKLIVIDSIQTIYSQKIDSSPGSVSQVRECAAQILQYAKKTNTPVILIGHITKDGSIAGPKVLEHIVDTVLQFEGDRHHFYRVLRTTKNRFGPTTEIGIFEMQNSGLVEISNPSEILLNQDNKNLSGTAVGVTIEGIRPFLFEVQALVSPAAYGTPQRTTTGFDNRRLAMLLAVLEKKAGFRFGNKDVFINIAGGIKTSDPAIDLAIISALLSSELDIALDNRICFAGELSLTGEIRPVNRIETRIQEAEKLGFHKIYIPDYKKSLSSSKTVFNISQIENIGELVRTLFSGK